MARYQADIRVYYEAVGQPDAVKRIRTLWQSMKNLAGDGMANHDLIVLSGPQAAPTPPIPPRKK
jgi:hypothetical protein